MQRSDLTCLTYTQCRCQTGTSLNICQIRGKIILYIRDFAGHTLQAKTTFAAEQLIIVVSCGSWLFHPPTQSQVVYVASHSFRSQLSSISSFGPLIILGGYHVTGRAFLLMAWTLFFPFSRLGLRTGLTLCRCLVVADFLAASSWFPFTCGIPSCL